LYYSYITRREATTRCETVGEKSMKNIALILLIIPSLSFADVKSSDLLPVVRYDSEVFVLKDKKGNEYVVETDCDIHIDEINEFTIRSKMVVEGTKIKFGKGKYCAVTTIVTT